MLVNHVIDVDAQDVGDFDLIGITVAAPVRLAPFLDVEGEGLLGALNLARSASRAAELGSVADDPDGAFRDGTSLSVSDVWPEP